MIIEKQIDKLNNLKSKLQLLINDSKNQELNDSILELLEAQNDQIDNLQEQNELLTQLLIQMKKHRFGKKSEGVSADQLKMFQELFQEPPVQEPVKASKEQDTVRKTKNGGSRQPLPDHLPREEVIIEVAESERHCPECDREKDVVGYETSECLEYIPPQLKVIRYKREKRVCRGCEDGMVTAPVADKLIDKGIPGPGLMAEILACKYQDHLPLYRIDKRFERLGYSVPRSSMSQWIQTVVETYLQPLGDRLKNLALSSYMLQTDDTPIRVQDRKHPQNIKKGYYWYYIGENRFVCVDYTENRKRAGPGTFLSDRTKGYIQSDGYTGYDHIFKAHPGLIQVGCWMHCRRYFIKALDAGDERADPVMSYIKELYKIEEKCLDLTSDKRREIRMKESALLLDAIKKWCLDNAGNIRPKSLLGRAIKYTLKHWTGLTVFVKDGAIPIDNGAVERALRPVAVGRKNYLFAGSDRAARNAAVVYSLLGCCNLENVNPWLYLRDVLQKLASGWLHSRIDELLPHQWKSLHYPELDLSQESK